MNLNSEGRFDFEDNFRSAAAIKSNDTPRTLGTASAGFRIGPISRDAEPITSNVNVNRRY